ncbi:MULTISPECIES: alpha/beta hydrolase family protein [unclassified Maridesulfovibrio]|uniref:alpha/beta hydrolase family protein n=1 Tax=unclassified Maridesulfovibrio TaxID=2794999 RepID=UPI003B3C31DF
MKKTILLLAIFIIHTAFAWAEVGIVKESFTDSNRDRSINTYIWYPCERGKTEKFADNPVFEGFNAVRNGTIKEGNYPLYIILHGTTGNWRNLSWLAARLAEDGAIAVAANHPGYTSGNATAASVIRVWDQPKDATFMLGEILKSRFKSHIDQSRIVAVGYSLGGYSALALAGARLDMHRYLEFCASHDDKACRYFKPTFSKLDQAFYKNSAMDLQDTRFTAAVAIAPGFMESFTQKSLKAIAIPTLIIGASLDKNVPPKTHLLPQQVNFSKTTHYKEIADATHFSFMQVCKAGGIDILKEEDVAFVCMDGEKTLRRDLHQKLYNLIITMPLLKKE